MTIIDQKYLPFEPEELHQRFLIDAKRIGIDLLMHSKLYYQYNEDMIN